MHFLITNDDGYAAPGILALEEALSALGEVTVVAPGEHLSGCSHQTTTDRPIRVEQPKPNHYVVDGMPADCVRVALSHLGLAPDWVISGINEGANLGCDLFYSGTVAAAREAVLLGKPAIAISHYLTIENPIHWRQAAQHTHGVIKQLISRTLPPGNLWNVNLPTADRLQAGTPVVECTPDPNPLAVAYQEREGSLHYVHGKYHGRPRSPGSDVDTCFGGEIAISQVPIFMFAAGQ